MEQNENGNYPTTVSNELEDANTMMTPYIKEELKWTILNNRHKRGLGEINLTEKKKSVKQELSSREVERRERRKAQNRKAADKCRKKKQKMNDQLIRDFIQEQEKTKKLTQEIEQLKREKEAMRRAYDDHAFFCTRSCTPSPSTTPAFDTQTTFDYGNHGNAAGFQAGEVDMMKREVVTPFQQDRFEETPAYSNDYSCMYPQTPAPLAVKPEAQPTCTMATDNELPQLDLPEDFFQFQPVSPDNLTQIGRQSISEFLDAEFLHQ